MPRTRRIVAGVSASPDLEAEPLVMRESRAR